VDAAGFVYVTDRGNSRVCKFTDSGQFVLSWGSYGTGPGQFVDPWGITADAAGRILVTNLDHDRTRSFDVEVFTSAGTFVNQFGPPGTDPGQLLTPTGVAVSPSDAVYVAGYGAIMKFDHDGSFLSKVDLGPNNIDMVVDAAGNAFVLDSQNMVVYKLDPAGNLLLAFGGQGTAPGFFHYPSGLAIDGAGNLYVADTSNERIQKFSPNGSLLSYWGTEGTGPGQFRAPMDVAIGPDGAIYVIDYYHVQKFGYAPTPVQSVTWGSVKARYRPEHEAAQQTAQGR